MARLAYNKVVSVEDFADEELVPHLDTVAYDEMVKFGLDSPARIPDSKQWECAMMLRTFADHDILKPGALIAGIGAGTEQTTFALASRGCVTFPVDRYLEVTPWSDVAPASMMVRPRQFTEFEFNRGHVIPIHSDARVLELPSNFFDGVYSAGSIEHFGSLDAVAAAAEEIARILKPGGVAAISTEFRLEGPNDRRWFDDTCILFTPELIHDYIVRPSGLTPLDELIPAPSQSTYDSRVVLLDFLAKATKVRTVEEKTNAYPNLVLFHEGFLFCSVHLALRKPDTDPPARLGYSRRFETATKEDAVAASGALLGQISTWRERFAKSDDDSLNKPPRLRELEREMERLERVELAFAALIEDGRPLDLDSAMDQAGLGSQGTYWDLVADYPAENITSASGHLSEGTLHSQGQDGVLCLGPYVSLSPGRYRVEYIVSAPGADRGVVVVDVTRDGSATVLVSDTVPAASLASGGGRPLALDFLVQESMKGMEFRLITQQGANVALKLIRLWRLRVSSPHIIIRPNGTARGPKRGRQGRGGMLAKAKAIRRLVAPSTPKR